MKKYQIKIIEIIGALGGLALLYLGSYRGPFETSPTLSERIALTIPIQILTTISRIINPGGEFRDSLGQNTVLIIILALVQVVLLGLLFGKLSGIIAKKMSGTKD